MKCFMESITHIDKIMKIIHRINSGNIVAMIVQKMMMTMENKSLIIININPFYLIFTIFIYYILKIYLF